MSRLDQLLEFLKEDPSDVFVLYSLAQEYLKADDLNNALGYFEKLKAAEPEYIGMYYHLGKLHERLGQPDQAQETYLEGIDIARNAGDIHAANEMEGALNLLKSTLDD